MVNVKNTLMMELALAEHNVSFESHIYSYGGHGFSTAKDWIKLAEVSARVPNCVGDSISWLNEIFGTLTPKGFAASKLPASWNSDFAPVLSVSCTVGHLLTQPETAQVVMQPFKDRVKAFAAAKEYSEELLWKIVENCTLKEVLDTLEYSDEAIASLDQQLHEIVNRLGI